MSPSQEVVRRDGIWWPKSDQNHEKNIAWVLRGLKDTQPVLKYVDRRGLCVQAGAHVGLWPIEFSKKFDRVVCFEPDPDLYSCTVRNVQDRGIKNVEVYNACLANANGKVTMRLDTTPGSGRIDDAGSSLCDCLALDGLGLGRVDLICLDVEGSETLALAGARDTIQSSQPIIQVELLPRSKEKIRKFMDGIGYRPLAAVGHRDWAFAPARWRR